MASDHSSLDDLKEIFSRPPTEARYSWIIHKDGTKTMEGRSSRVFHRNKDTDRRTHHENEKRVSTNDSPFHHGHSAERTDTSPPNSDTMRHHHPFHGGNNEKLLDLPSPVNPSASSSIGHQQPSGNGGDSQQTHHHSTFNGNHSEMNPDSSLRRPPLRKRVSFSNTEEFIQGSPIINITDAAAVSTETLHKKPNSIETSEESHGTITSPRGQILDSPRSSHHHNSRQRNAGEENTGEEEEITSPRAGPDGVHSRVFGDRYNYTKGHVRSLCNSTIEPPLRLTGNNPHDLIAEYQYKNTRLQEELNSNTKKIQKLNKINENALNRKEELQNEILGAYKKISELEVERNAMVNERRELEIEIKTTKQRLGDAEREAANAIGQCSKLERALQDTEVQKKKYFEDLSIAERQITKLENLLKEIDEEHKNETEERNELRRKLYETESSLRFAESENKSLQNQQEIFERDNKTFKIKLNKENQEKENVEEKASKLLKANVILRDEIKRLESKYEAIQRNLDHSSVKVNFQKEKFDMASADKQRFESELRETRRILSKEKFRRQKINTEQKLMSEQLSELRETRQQTKQRNEHLERENRILKDKVLYFELYKKINEEKPTRVSLKVGNGEQENVTQNRQHYLFDTLEQIKNRRNRKMEDNNNSNNNSNNNTNNNNNISTNNTPRTFQHLRDESMGEKRAYERSRKPRERSISRGSSLRKLSASSAASSYQLKPPTPPELDEINAKIEQLQSEQTMFNHVTTESMMGSGRNASCPNSERNKMTPRRRSESIKFDEDISQATDGDNGGGAEEMDEVSSNLPSFGDELKSEDEIEVENLVNFSDFLHDEDLASALM